MPEIPATEDRRPLDLLWLVAAIPFLLLVVFTVQGSVEVRSSAEQTVEVLVDGKPARSFAPGIHRTGLMLIGPHQVTIRESGRPERLKTVFVWLSQRVVVRDGPSSQPEVLAVPVLSEPTRHSMEAGARTEAPVVPAQSEPSRLGTEAPAAASPIETQPQSNTFTGEVLELRVFNVDDVATATINGTQVLSARYRDDTGFVNLTDRCTPGANQVGFQLDNLGSGYTWGFEMRVDGKTVWHQEEGIAGSQGAHNNDQRMGRVFDETVTFVRNAPAQALASSDKTALEGSEVQPNNGVSGSDATDLEEQEVTVSARDANGVTTRPLAPNTAYNLEVSGTWDAWGDTNHGVDAVECFAQPRCNQARKRKLYQSLRVDGQGLVDLSGGTLSYSPTHTYKVVVTGRGQPLRLWIQDARDYGGRSASDNVGTLLVRIARTP